MSDARRRLDELTRKVDGFFAGVAERQRGQMQCRPGCSACCQPGLTVTGIEAAAIREVLAALPHEARARLRQRADGEGDACAALEADGTCAIYPARPLVCRSHGAPVRVAREGGLPVVETCALNFPDGLGGVPPSDVLDQATLSTILLALDAAHADDTGAPRGERVAIRTLCGDDAC